MNCSGCGRLLRTGDKFCQQCGAPQPGPKFTPASSPEIVPVSQPQPRNDNKQFLVWFSVVALIITIAVGGIWYSSRDNDATTIPAETVSPAESVSPSDPSITPEPLPAESEVTGSLLYYTSATAPSTSADSQDNSGNPTTYDAVNMLDDDPDTAWRMDGTAAGTTLTFSFDTVRTVDHLGLINGLAKRDPKNDEDRYVQNRRVLAVTWIIGGIAKEQSLVDGNRSFQYITFDPIKTGTVQLRIDEVSDKGTGSKDRTAISDVFIAND